MNTVDIPKISVIVPVYNGSKYLSVMVDSILAQTYRDFELLLIDDGSTDGSSNIIDDYAKKDDRVKAFHKSNGGLSSARNYGLDNACGKYIVFADCDDYMYPDNLEVMYNEIQGFDLLVCNYAQGYRSEFEQIKRNAIIRSRAFAENIEELSKNILEIDVWYMAMCWNKMYLRSCIEDNNLRFRNIKSEDEVWSYEFLNYANSVKRIDWMGLCYFHNPGSLGNGHKAIPEMDWFRTMDDLYSRLYKKLNINNKSYDNRVNFRFIIRLTSFLLKGYYPDTKVSRQERINRWKDARCLMHRLICDNKYLTKRNRFVMWILKTKVEKIFDPILFAAI